MSYTASISLSIGSSRTGYSLSAQLYDTNAIDVGSEITTGFVEIGGGNYLWTYTGFPDNFRGGVKFWQSSNPSKILAATSINPEDTELVSKINATVSSSKEVTVEVPHIVAKDDNVTITGGSSTPSRNIEIKTGVQ